MSSSSIERREPRALPLAAALLSAAACATAPRTNLRESYQTTKTGDNEISGLSSLLEVGAQDELTNGLSYRVSERLLRNDVTLSEGDETTRSNTTQSQTSLDTVLGTDTLRWSQGLDLQTTRSESEESADTGLDRVDILEKIEWTPSGLPRVTAWVNARTDSDDLYVDRQDVESVLQIDETRGPFNYLYALEVENIVDSKTDVERDRLEQLFRGSYRDTWLDGKLTGSLSVFLNDRSLETRAPQGALPGTEVAAVQGLAAIDSTPGIAILPSVPGLIDGDLTTPLGINIGGFASGGQDDWNIGLELFAPTPVNTLLLTTQDEVDTFLAGDFNFEIWASDDNEFWTLVTGSAPYTYQALDRNFRILLPEVEARYLKVVNTVSPAAAGAVLITEIEAFAPPTFGGSESKVNDDDTTTNATGVISWRATEDLNLTYDVFVQRADREIGGDQTRDETRIENGATALWTPTELFDARAHAEAQMLRDPVRLDEDLVLINGLLGVHPLETLDLALSYTESSRDVAGESNLDTRAAQGRVTAQLLPKLSADLSLERSVQSDFANDRDIERVTLSSALNAELTRTLDMTVGYRKENADVSGAGAAGIPDPSEREFETLFLYQPSDQFTSEVRLTWQRNYTGSGLDQKLRVGWIPFREGAIDLQLDVDRTRAGITETQIDRYLAQARWTLNPRAFIEMNVSTQIPDEGDRSTTATIGLSIVR